MADWRHLSLCRDDKKHDPETWFPAASPGTKAYEAQVEKPKAICAECPVRRDCLDDAIDRGLDHGVFGGLDQDERRALKRRRSRHAQVQPIPAPLPKAS